MKIYKEEHLKNFNAWAGAVYTIETLTDEELDIIEHILEDENPDGMDETELNDFLWFERDTIAYWLGYDDWEELLEKRK